jgi:hypothetical protein
MAQSTDGGTHVTRAGCACHAAHASVVPHHVSKNDWLRHRASRAANFRARPCIQNQAAGAGGVSALGGVALSLRPPGRLQFCSMTAPPLFLTDAEIEFMTGYTQPAAQIRWLQKWQIRHVVNASGYPRVTRSAVEGTRKAEPERHRSEPNWAAFDDWKTGTHWRHKRRRQEMGIPEPITEPKEGNAKMANRNCPKVAK